MIRPVDVAPTQLFGDNPTNALPATHWIIKQFGNYQPDGHTGEDYPCKSGTPVRAVTAGIVLHVGRLGGTYADNPWWIAPSFAGFVYVVDHGAFIGIYGHCLDGGARVTGGQRVTEGQVLGLSGNTGASTGDHLHFEILPDGYVLNSKMYGRVNPETLFSGLSYQSTTITPLEDELSAEFERDVRAQLEKDAQDFGKFDRDVRAQLQSLPDFDRDVRADLAAKGAQITALTSTVDALAAIVGHEQGLDVEQIKSAVTAAIAAGLTITVEAGK